MSAGLPLDEEQEGPLLGVSLLKVTHDRQQLEWLLQRAVLPEQPYRAVAHEYARLEGSTGREGGRGRHHLTAGLLWLVCVHSGGTQST